MHHTKVFLLCVQMTPFDRVYSYWAFGYFICIFLSHILFSMNFRSLQQFWFVFKFLGTHSCVARCTGPEHPEPLTAGPRGHTGSSTRPTGQVQRGSARARTRGVHGGDGTATRERAQRTARWGAFDADVRLRAWPKTAAPPSMVTGDDDETAMADGGGVPNDGKSDHVDDYSDARERGKGSRGCASSPRSTTEGSARSGRLAVAGIDDGDSVGVAAVIRRCRRLRASRQAWLGERRRGRRGAASCQRRFDRGGVELRQWRGEARARDSVAFGFGKQGREWAERERETEGEERGGARAGSPYPLARRLEVVEHGEREGGSDRPVATARRERTTGKILHTAPWLFLFHSQFRSFSFYFSVFLLLTLQ